MLFIFTYILFIFTYFLSIFTYFLFIFTSLFLLLINTEVSQWNVFHIYLLYQLLIYVYFFFSTSYHYRSEWVECFWYLPLLLIYIYFTIRHAQTVGVKTILKWVSVMLFIFTYFTYLLFIFTPLFLLLINTEVSERNAFDIYLLLIYIYFFFSTSHQYGSENWWERFSASLSELSFMIANLWFPTLY